MHTRLISFAYALFQPPKTFQYIQSSLDRSNGHWETSLLFAMPAVVVPMFSKDPIAHIFNESRNQMASEVEDQLTMPLTMDDFSYTPTFPPLDFKASFFNVISIVSQDEQPKI